MARFRLVILDGDDTLWETMALYRAAKSAFSSLLSKHGFDGARGVAMLEEIDLRNAAVYGFSPKRFPDSMAEAHRRLAAEASRDASPAITEEARSIAVAVFDQAPRLVEGVNEALTSLGKEHQVVLCTKGDKAIQQARLASSGLAPYFTRIYIPATKGKDEFAGILTDCGVEPTDAISVGDSLRSDINPAIELGMCAIWVPNENWAFEDALQVRSSRLFRASTLRLVPAVIAGIERDQNARRSA